MKTLGYTSIFAVLVAGPVVAGSLEAPAPEPVLTPVFEAPPASGEWDGFYVGAQLGFGDGDIAPAGTDIDGELYGLHAGYMADLGNWVAGGELDYDLAGLDVGTAGDEIDEVVRLKALAGYDLGATLLYGTVGAFNANLETGAGDVDDNGYLLGVGVKQKLTDNWVAGAELLYHAANDFGGAAGADVGLTTLSARVSFQF
jgi:opacity protein-like surface antigen